MWANLLFFLLNNFPFAKENVTQSVRLIFCCAGREEDLRGLTVKVSNSLTYGVFFNNLICDISWKVAYFAFTQFWHFLLCLTLSLWETQSRLQDWGHLAFPRLLSSPCIYLPLFYCYLLNSHPLLLCYSSG